MAIEPKLPKNPALPKKRQVRLSTRDLKAKKNPRGGAQKKEIIDPIGLTSNRNTTTGFNL